MKILLLRRTEVIKERQDKTIDIENLLEKISEKGREIDEISEQIRSEEE